jgi:hypothetical protein
MACVLCRNPADWYSGPNRNVSRQFTFTHAHFRITIKKSSKSQHIRQDQIQDFFIRISDGYYGKGNRATKWCIVFVADFYARIGFDARSDHMSDTSVSFDMREHFDSFHIMPNDCYEPKKLHLIAHHLKNMRIIPRTFPSFRPTRCEECSMYTWDLDISEQGSESHCICARCFIYRVSRDVLIRASCCALNECSCCMTTFIIEQMMQHFEVKVIISRFEQQYVILFGNNHYASKIPIPRFLVSRVVGDRRRINLHKNPHQLRQDDEPCVRR